MRLIFAGTPAAAVPSLHRLTAGPHEIAAVVTRPPAPTGRRRVVTPSPVHEAALEHGLPVLEAARLDADATAHLAALDADLGVVVAYGALLREPLLSAPRLGWINLHFSALPRWRGAAPVQRAVIAGETDTAVTVFQLEAGLDTGAILRTDAVAIGALETAGHLLERLAVAGADTLADVVDALAEGTAVARPQQGEPTVAPKLTVDDGRIDWTVPAVAAFARIRGVTPEPGAFTLDADGGRLKVLEAAPARDAAALPPGAVQVVERRILIGTGDQPLELLRVQPAGRSAMPADAWMRGLASPPVFA